MYPKNGSDTAALKGVSNENASTDVSDEGVPVNFKEGSPKDDFEEGVTRPRNAPAGDQVPSTSPKAEVPDSDADSDPDSEVPDSDPGPRKKRKTEVEDLEIDLKGLNSVHLSPMIQSLVSDKALTHNDEDNGDSNTCSIISELFVKLYLTA